PESSRMAAFPSRDHEAFMAHWARCLADKMVVVQAILFGGRVAGNIVCWDRSGERTVGYWIGREFWGRGIATAALSQFLDLVKERPLVACVAKHNVASLRVAQKCGFTISGEGTFSLADSEDGEEFILTLT